MQKKSVLKLIMNSRGVQSSFLTMGVLTFLFVVFCIPCTGETTGSKNPFLSVSNDKIVNRLGEQVHLRGFHFECFSIVPKDLFDAAYSSNKDFPRECIQIADIFCGDQDIINIREMGANVVRIAFRLWQIEKSPHTYDELFLQHMDKVIDKFAKAGIYTIIDLHAAGQNSLKHNREYGNRLWSDERLRKRVIDLWVELAKRYKNNPWIAGYDLLNEPEAPNQEALRNFYRELITAVRSIDNNHIIFLQKDVRDSEKPFIIEFSREPNLVWSLHFYKPGQFTFQGFGGRPTGHMYPDFYDNVLWDKGQIEKYFDKILKMPEIKNTPLFVGEFSASTTGNGEQAIQWIRDVIETLNDRGIHYTYFEYKAPQRPALALYVPSEKANRGILDIRKKLISGKETFSNLRQFQKDFLATHHYELSPVLREVLTKGFNKKLDDEQSSSK